MSEMQSSAVRVPERIFLASASPRRSELLIGLGLQVDVRPSHLEEIIDPTWSPAQAVVELAKQKAQAVFQNLSESDRSVSSGLTVGADTVVAIHGQILGKPINEIDAFRMLKLLQNATHEVYTGIAVVDRLGQVYSAVGCTRVVMKAMSDERIRRYISTGEPMDKAGAYAIQGYCSAVIERIEGCYFNVVGFPISLFEDILQNISLEAW